MAAIPYGVATSFLNGEYATSGAFKSIGGELFSYAMKLAHQDPSGRVVLDYKPLVYGGKAPSVTTARHMRALEGSMLANDMPLVTAECYHRQLTQNTRCAHCGFVQRHDFSQTSAAS